MIFAKNTPNNTGIAIYGDFMDFENLYEALHNVVGDEDELIGYYEYHYQTTFRGKGVDSYYSTKINNVDILINHLYIFPLLFCLFSTLKKVRKHSFHI